MIDCSLNAKKLLGRILREHLESYKLDSQLFVALLATWIELSWEIMKACIILHNMIIEDERDSYDLAFEYEDVEGSIPEPVV